MEKCSEVFYVSQKFKAICKKPKEMSPRWLKILGRLGNFI
jgi:hypothetical protein